MLQAAEKLTPSTSRRKKRCLYTPAFISVIQSQLNLDKCYVFLSLHPTTHRYVRLLSLLSLPSSHKGPCTFTIWSRWYDPILSPHVLYDTYLTLQYDLVLPLCYDKALFNFLLLYDVASEVSPTWLTPVYLQFVQVAVTWLHLSFTDWTTSLLIDDSLLVHYCDSVLGGYTCTFLLFYLGI